MTNKDWIMLIGLATYMSFVGLILMGNIQTINTKIDAIKQSMKQESIQSPVSGNSHRMRAYPYSEVRVTSVGYDNVYFLDPSRSEIQYMSNDKFNELYESLEAK